MTGERSVLGVSAGTLVLGTALIAIAVPAWLLVLRSSASMSMPGPSGAPSVAEGAAFTLQWGVMMAAMMLPSAAPMILLYRTVSRRLSAEGTQVVPVLMFVTVYLFLWLLLGLPVYGASVALESLAGRHHAVGAAVPYAVAGVLIAAGVYQLTDAKRACLRHCESPLGFLMRRWRPGYGATLRIAAEHAGYCIGCCWGLMVILVAAGAMSIAWVLVIAAVVFAEKVLPHGRRTARFVGLGLIALGIAVACRPRLAGSLRPNQFPVMRVMGASSSWPDGPGV